MQPSESELIYDWNAAAGRARPGARPRRVERRDPARRPAVAVGEDADDRAEARDPPRPGGDRHRLAEHRPAGRRTARRRRRDALAQEIVDQKLAIAANCAARTLEADIRPIVEISQRTGLAIEVACFLGSSPIRQYTEGWEMAEAPRADARGGRARDARGPAGDVRHRGHDARPARGRARPLHGGGRGRSAPDLHRRHGRARDARRGAQPRPLPPPGGGRHRRGRRGRLARAQRPRSRPRQRHRRGRGRRGPDSRHDPRHRRARRQLRARPAAGELRAPRLEPLEPAAARRPLRSGVAGDRRRDPRELSGLRQGRLPHPDGSARRRHPQGARQGARLARRPGLLRHSGGDGRPAAGGRGRPDERPGERHLLAAGARTRGLARAACRRSSAPPRSRRRCSPKSACSPSVTAARSPEPPHAAARTSREAGAGLRDRPSCGFPRPAPRRRRIRPC